MLRIGYIAIVAMAGLVSQAKAQTPTCRTDAAGVTQCSQSPRYQSDRFGIVREDPKRSDAIEVPDLMGEGQSEDVGAAWQRLTPPVATGSSRNRVGSCNTDAVGITRC